MTLEVQFQRVCQVQIQRLLLVACIMVVVVVICQFIVFPYEKNISVLSDGSNILHSIELTSSDNIRHEMVSTRVASPKFKEDTLYKSEANDDGEDYDFPIDNEEMEHISETGNMNYGNNLTLDVILDKSSTMRHVRSADKSTVTEKEMKTKPLILEKVKKLNLTKTRENDYKPITLPTKWELGNQIGLGTQHKNVEITISDVQDIKSIVAGSTSKTKSRRKPMSITNMTALWLQSGSTVNSKRSRWSSSRDRELHHARLQLNNAPEKSNPLDLYASVFRNVSTFKRSYDLMEHKLKVYIYNEGEKPIFHNPKTRGIYASEGWFMSLMKKNRQFVVKDPRKAHLFYLPFSSTMLRIAIGEQNHTSQMGDLYLKNYINIIAKKYRFWNRTSGADHFLVACHDWAPKLTRTNMGNCIRALCNTNIASGFKIGKDVSLPVTYIRTANDPQKDLGGNPPSERPILAFFAGSMHGYLRPILLQYWNNRESDMIISGPMPRTIEGKAKYRELMKSSKYCICAKGYEVHTPRIVESIFYECIPVIISDNYVPPFLEVLEWEAFSVFILEEDIPNLRNILLSIPEERYLAMQHRVKMVQQHFLWHKIPLKYDLFHMILHSVWYNRIFQLKSL